VKPVVVLAEAAEDLESAREFYEAISAGLGDHCVALLLADLPKLAVHHGIHPAHFGSRRLLASRLPFGIYYIESTSEVQVIAILDLRRKPSWIRHQLRERRP
jgi:plasmid stabilization system protein ParE